MLEAAILIIALVLLGAPAWAVVGFTAVYLVVAATA